MAYNYLDLVNEINRRLNEVELTTTNFITAKGFYQTAKDAVNSSIRHINHEEFNWPWNHREEEEILSAGVMRYPYPEDAKVLDENSFRLKRNDTLGIETKKLKSLDYQEYLDNYIDYEYNTSTGIRGVPNYIVRTPSQEFIFVPCPDKAYELVYEYYQNPVILEQASDVPSVPQEFRHVIVDGAMYYAFQFRGDTQNSQLSERKFKEGIKYMRSIYINRYEYIRSTVIDRTSGGLNPRVF
jgi:hypothetical protein|tara:strand:+ start:1138 stop:1857 length:720 start_codon:yes stop_codon:yes gene_type:complete